MHVKYPLHTKHNSHLSFTGIILPHYFSDFFQHISQVIQSHNKEETLSSSESKSKEERKAKESRKRSPKKTH